MKGEGGGPQLAASSRNIPISCVIVLLNPSPPGGLYTMCNEFEVFKVAYSLEKLYRKMAACKMMDAFT